MDRVTTISVLGVNLTYLYRYGQSSALVVDPCENASVLRILKKRELSLTIILVTHHHWDDVAGVRELKRQAG